MKASKESSLEKARNSQWIESERSKTWREGERARERESRDSSSQLQPISKIAKLDLRRQRQLGHWLTMRQDLFVPSALGTQGRRREM